MDRRRGRLRPGRSAARSRQASCVPRLAAGAPRRRPIRRRERDAADHRQPERERVAPEDRVRPVPSDAYVRARSPRRGTAPRGSRAPRWPRWSSPGPGPKWTTSCPRRCSSSRITSTRCVRSSVLTAIFMGAARFGGTCRRRCGAAGRGSRGAPAPPMRPPRTRGGLAGWLGVGALAMVQPEVGEPFSVDVTLESLGPESVAASVSAARSRRAPIASSRSSRAARPTSTRHRPTPRRSRQPDPGGPGRRDHRMTPTSPSPR